MIKLILVSVLLAFFVYAIQQRKKIFFVSLLISFFSLVGTFLVIFPGMSNRIANILGVGRGADLLLYFFVVGGAIVVFNLHLKNRALLDRHTKLVRHIAILEKKVEDKFSAVSDEE
ncbi:DUF2304 domain-containing protein [Plesiomonas shigelloides]|uniref:DUF2304 domain-containing protein n=1 Tax=Plesiomonas shigelloides TaxID=703 RepID=UPI0022457407|nr:DUF2304 domain-containing protein [Plesiomonas shigelloides]MCX2532816.1 DUF2304 domain-containing protein [Plesiomonas shigelloides]